MVYTTMEDKIGERIRKRDVLERGGREREEIEERRKGEDGERDRVRAEDEEEEEQEETEDKGLMIFPSMFGRRGHRL